MSSDTAQRLRIDELAQRSGIASGTIRFYQREGLIDPPEREGRVAYYAPEHLDRLARVRALQAQGLPLSLVGDLLRREDAGEDIAGWLALDAAVFGERPDQAEPADPKALKELGLGDEDVAALDRAGVLAVPGMLELTARLLDGGVPPDAIRAGTELITVRLKEIADAMAMLGWEVFAPERRNLESGEPAPDEVLEKLEHLRSLAQRIVSTLFPALLAEAIRERSAPFAAEAVERRMEES